MNYQTEKREGHTTITLTKDAGATDRPSGKFIIYGADGRPPTPRRVLELREDGSSSRVVAFEERITARVTDFSTSADHSFS